MSHDQENYASQQDPDPEVVPKAKRRQFSVKIKLRILNEHEACTEHGEKGAFNELGFFETSDFRWLAMCLIVSFFKYRFKEARRQTPVMFC